MNNLSTTHQDEWGTDPHADLANDRRLYMASTLCVDSGQYVPVVAVRHDDASYRPLESSLLTGPDCLDGDDAIIVVAAAEASARVRARLTRQADGEIVPILLDVVSAAAATPILVQSRDPRRLAVWFE